MSSAELLAQSFAGLLASLGQSKALGRAAKLVVDAQSKGHVYVELRDTADLPIEPTLICQHQQALQALPNCKAPLVLDAGRLYLWRNWWNEVRLARSILQAQERPAPWTYPATPAQDAALAPPTPNNQAAENGLTLSPEQQHAIACAKQKRITLLSGGPGSGKTTTVAALARSLLAAQPDSRYALLAPTGKAAARLGELIGAGQAATTIHRFLGSKPSGVHRPLRKLDWVIVDEASMIDLALLADLFSVLPKTCKIILLGDPNQLTAVDVGASFAELCSSAFFEQHADLANVRLPRNFRSGGRLSLLADAVLQANAEECWKLLQSADTALSLTTNAQSWQQAMLLDWQPLRQALQQRAEPATVLQLLAQIRVLCATHHGPLGTLALNEVIGRSLSPQAAAHGWFHGRAVLVERNDYQLGLFNGDVGVALQIAGRLKVYFGPSQDLQTDAVQHQQLPAQAGALREWSPENLQGVSSAFACSIHRAQGHEFQRVWLALPEPSEQSAVLSRELLYTGITRARQSLHLCASQAALQQAIATKSQRNGSLLARLHELGQDSSIQTTAQGQAKEPG